MRIAMQCGQDSDCNPSSVGAILGNWTGVSGIPDKFKLELEPGNTFFATSYSFDDAISLNLDLTRQTLILAGAVSEGAEENESWTIPRPGPVRATILEQWPQEPNAPPALTAQILSQHGLEVNLKAEATDADGVLAYDWSFGDLSRGQGQQVTHQYATTGTYEILVFAADAIGNTSWKAIEVTVP